MKKVFIAFTVLVASVVASCNRLDTLPEEVILDNGMKQVTIRAFISADETKTSYAGGTSFSWTAGDEISVLCSDNNFYTFTAGSSTASTTFSGAIPEDVNVGDKAFFPADAGHTSSKFSVPKSKDLTSHPSADLPMVGVKSGDAFSFSHCSGAALLTINNIPDGISSVQISLENASLKLSGLFSLKNIAETNFYYWEPEDKAGDNAFFIRKVSVTGNSAQVYIPYSCDPSYGNMWAASTLNITGYDAINTPTTLVSDKTMKALGTFTRAHIKPLTSIIISRLEQIDWSGVGVATSVLSPSDSRKCLSELKVISDAHYMYVRLRGPLSEYAGDYLDIYLSDGSGDNYALANDNKYWSTGGTNVYIKEHKGTITSSSLSLNFNDKTVETKTISAGDDIYWYMAIPRSAHSLLSSSGTVYVGFVLWNGWAVTGVIPTKYSSMLEVSLP